MAGPPIEDASRLHQHLDTARMPQEGLRAGTRAVGARLVDDDSVATSRAALPTRLPTVTGQFLRTTWAKLPDAARWWFRPPSVTR